MHNPKLFKNTPPDTVALDRGLAYLFANYHRQAEILALGRHILHAKRSRPLGFAITISVVQRTVPPKTVLARNHQSVSELGATLEATSLYDFLAGLAGHALEKAMLPGAFALFGLEGSFGH